MEKIKLKDAIKGKKTVSYEKKPSLWAMKCDCCGLIFTMDRYCNDRLEPAVLYGTFSDCAIDKDGRGLGNMFQATVCSFKCAHEIFNGDWQKISEYKPYKKIGAKLVRAELNITSLIKTKEELISEWGNK